MELPKDPMILLSFVNTKLRDNYASLTELKKSLSVDGEKIEETLATIGYHYDKKLNRFC